MHKYLYCHANPINGLDPSGLGFDLSSLSTALCVAGLIIGITGLIMLGIGHFSGNTTMRDIGLSLFVAGIVIVGSGYLLAAEVLTAAEAATIAALTALTEVMYTLSEAGLSQAVENRVAPSGQLRNLILASSDSQIPSHGIVILRNGAKINSKIGAVDWNYRDRPPYINDDVVFEFTIDLDPMSIQVTIWRVIDALRFPPRTEILQHHENVEIDAYGNIIQGTGWLLLGTEE